MTLLDLERALQRYGDELYRLALLLTPDEASAALLLVNTVRGLLADSTNSLDEPALFAALADALPPERRRWRRPRLPGWTHPPSALADSAPLLALLARLPRGQRLVLGLAMLPGLDLGLVTPIFAGDELQARSTLRDALLALAPCAAPDLGIADLGFEDAPAACQQTRAALALGVGQVHSDPALRGHLALCDGCRAAEQAWQQLYSTVEHALRGALRDRHLPAAVAAHLRAVLSPAPATSVQVLLADPRVRLGLVACAVLALIGLLVLPRRPAAEPAAGTTGVAASPRDLISRAQANLYTPPPGHGIWHGRWEVRWGFPGDTYAPLVGDLWIDPTTGYHRVQLVHHDGGGPYEFELSNSTGKLWYATTATYGPSLYPLIFDPQHMRVQLQLPADQQAAMLKARLSSGAWDLAASYLRQAQAAGALRSWGRQRLPDGTLVEVIGFRGVSPLALPPDAPAATASQATVLLMIDPQSGTLREVHELLGQEGGEQTGRLTWRFLSGGWVTDTTEAARIFDYTQAWNGLGSFSEQEGVADPALPLVPARAIKPLVYGLQTATWMPTGVPTGTLRAVLIDQSWQPNRPKRIPGANLASFYIGAGRRLAIMTQPNGADQDVPPADERIVLNGKPFGLQASTAYGYRATMLDQNMLLAEPTIMWFSGFGYTRAELLATLRTVDHPSIASYYVQAHIFVDQSPADPAAFEALLQALKPIPLPPDTARHYVERAFMRQDQQPDPLPDPYHLKRYRGWPAQVQIDDWERTTVLSGTLGTEVVATTRGVDGTLYAKQYVGPTEVWYYDTKMSTINRYRADTLPLANRTSTDMLAVLNMIACGKGRLTTLADGTRVISASIVLDQQPDPCKSNNYDELLLFQRQNAIWADAPYLLDVADQPITTWLYLGADGRLVRSEERAGMARDGVLLSSWELVSDERVQAGQVPAETFDTRPPPALSGTDSIEPSSPPAPTDLMHQVRLTETLDLITTPVFSIPPDAQTGLPHIVVSSPQGNKPRSFSGPDDFGTEALWHGLALHFTYGVTTSDGFAYQQLFEGPAVPFGDLLRTRETRWEYSAPITLRIGERTLAGWQIATSTDQWALVEIDGTLLALEANTPLQRAAISRLQRVSAP
jgi:hypothetical protein